MSFLLDTNVISEYRKGTACDPNVAAWFGKVTDSQLFLSVLVMGELRKGAEAKARRDPAQAEALRKWITLLERGYGDRILPFGREEADIWGRMNALRPRSTVDSMLAATAKVHGMTLVTRNVADVEGLGVEVLNPFKRP